MARVYPTHQAVKPASNKGRKGPKESKGESAPPAEGEKDQEEQKEGEGE